VKRPGRGPVQSRLESASGALIGAGASDSLRRFERSGEFAAMIRRRLSVLIAVALALAAGPVAARAPVSQAEAASAIGPADRAAITARIEVLVDALSSGRLVETLDVVPPRLLQATAARFGATQAQLRQAFAENAAQLFAGVSFVSCRMDLDAAAIRLTPDGARTYLLIPTETVIDAGGAGRVRTVSQTLAMQDEGRWYLIRVQDAAQREVLTEVYPEFAGVDFPAATTGPAD
jgi:hypothetical protein